MNNNIKAIIIDDEDLARDVVKKYLESFPEIEIICECSDGFSGVKMINEHKPDIVFLDIQMPKLNGFEVLELIDNFPAVVFCTAFDNYAIQAFEKNAADYLLKPFSLERFKQAVDKAKNQMQIPEKNKQLVHTLINQIPPKNEFTDRIAVKTGKNIQVIPIEKILYIEACDDYVEIHTANERFLKNQTMKYFEQHLDNSRFVRVHRSYIVNIAEVKQIELYEKENYILTLKNNARLKASIAGYKLIKNLLSL